MELRTIRSFVAVAEDLHFTRAAERLHLAQPALSQQIRQLERDLGADLFERTSRSVRLTEAGRVFLDHARKLLNDAGSARLAAQRAARGEIGHLSVGFVPAARDLIPAASRRYRSRFPEVEVTIRETDGRTQAAALREGSLQVGLLNDTVDLSGLDWESLRRERFVLALAADHRLAARRSIAIPDLRDERFVGTGSPSGDRASLNRVILTACARAGFEPVVAASAVDLSTRLVLVASGYGVAFVLDRARPRVAHGIVFRHVQGAALTLDLLVAWRKGNEAPAAAAFRDLLHEALRVATRSRTARQ